MSGLAPGGEGGVVSTFDAVYHDIVPNERIVYSYEMYMAGMRMSVSVTTVQLSLEPGGTKLTYTE